MRTKHWLAFCLVTLLDVAAACLGPANNLSHAVAARGCGPADGPATEIVLADEPIRSLQPPTPYVRIMIDAPVTAIAGSWIINQQAGASYVRARDLYEQATSGTVNVTAVDNTKLSGLVDIDFPTRHVVTDFHALLILNSAITPCG